MIRLLVAVVMGALGLVILAPVLLLLAPFVLVWAAHRVLVRLIEPVVTPDHQILEFDPGVGWRPKAGLHIHAVADDVYRLSTGVDGWRGSLSLEASDIVVFGDSFAFGHAAGDHKFFAAADLSLRIKAIGADGYNLVQELIWMRRLSAQLAGKLVVWFIFLGNDIFENLQPCIEGSRAPFIRKNSRSKEWEIVTGHLDASPWPSGFRYYNMIFMEQYAAVFAPGPVADRMFDACRFLFEQAKRTVDDGGGRLVILSVPSRRQLSAAGQNQLRNYLPDPAAFDCDYPDQRLRAICVKLGIPFVAGKDHLDVHDYLRHDAHWNAKGHRRVANLLRQLQHEFGAASVRPVPSATEGLRGMAMAGAVGQRPSSTAR